MRQHVLKITLSLTNLRLDLKHRKNCNVGWVGEVRMSGRQVIWVGEVGRSGGLVKAAKFGQNCENIVGTLKFYCLVWRNAVGNYD